MKTEAKVALAVGTASVLALLFKDEIKSAFNSAFPGADSAGGYGGADAGAGSFSSNYPGLDNYPTTQGTGYPWNQALLDAPPTPEQLGQNQDPTDIYTVDDRKTDTSGDGGSSQLPQGENTGKWYDNSLFQLGAFIAAPYALEGAGKGAKWAWNKMKGSDRNLGKLNENAKIEEGLQKRNMASQQKKLNEYENGKTINEKYKQNIEVNRKVKLNENVKPGEFAKLERSAASSESKLARLGKTVAGEGKLLSKAGRTLGFVATMGALAYEGTMFINDMLTGIKNKGLNKEGLKEGAGSYGYRTLNMFGGVDMSIGAIQQQQQQMMQSLQKVQSNNSKSSAPMQNYTTPTRTVQTITTKAAPYAVGSAVGGGTIMSNGSIIYASSNTASASKASTAPATVNGVKPAGYNTNTPGQVGQYTTSTGGKSTAPTMKLSDYKSSSSSSSKKK